LLEAYNTDRWDGWTRVPSNGGPVAFLMDNVDSYLNLKPKVATEQASGTNTGALVGLVIAVVVVVAIVVVLMLRRRAGRAEEG